MEEIKKSDGKNNLRKILMIAAASFVVLASAGFFIYRANAESVTGKPAAEITATRATSKTSLKTPLEVHIANNGAVLLRGARVVSISGNTIFVTTSWDSAAFVWEVRTRSFFTEFLTSAGEAENFSDIRVGDTLSVSGNLMGGGGASPVIDGRFLRE